MKRRWLSGILTAVLILCLATTFPITAKAASSMTVSSQMIDVLKTMEGFSAKPYWDHSQWSVGYGTECPSDKLAQYQAYGIPEAEALALLAQELVRFQTEVNSFIDRYGLKLKQHQFDALVSFTYNCGGSWMNETTGYFNTAVREGASASDFLYGICLYSTAGSEYILMDRRLCEANMYINGAYKAYNVDSIGNPEHLKYVFLDGNGGDVRYSICGFDTREEAPIRVSFTSIPTGIDSKGKPFAYQLEGWYTAEGIKVEKLDSNLLCGEVLYARWTDPAGNPVKLGKGDPETMTVTVTGDGINVRRGPATFYPLVTTYANGQSVQLTRVYQSGGYTWGKTQHGWFRLDNSNYAQLKAAKEQFPKNGTVTANDVNYRSGPSTSDAIVGKLNKGARVSISQEAEGSGLRWGKMADGNWVCLDYVQYDENSRQITGVTLVRQPDRTTYVQKESLKLEGSVLLVTYHDGSTEALTLTRSMITSYNNSNLGNTTVVASYGGFAVSFPVNIVKATVTFRNWDGTVLATKQYAYGEAISQPATPARADEGMYTFTFTGWDLPVTACAGNAEYTACYKKTQKSMNHPYHDWQLVGDRWYCYEKGALVRNQWRKDSKGWVWLSEDGSMLTDGWAKDSTGWCYMGQDGYMVTNAWAQDNHGWCYLNSSGYIAKDTWVYDGGYWYYMDRNGYMVTGTWKNDGAGSCYLGRTGAMVTHGWAVDSGKLYWMDGSGRIVKNTWIEDSNGWHYLGADGAAVTDTWMKDNKGWCYLDSDSTMRKNNWVSTDGKWYYLDNDGYMVANQWIKDSLGWVWLGQDGAMVTNAWVRDSVDWCYVGADGYCLTNTWKRDTTGWCYLDSNGNMTRNQWVCTSGKWYYLDSNGYMVANNWMKDSTDWVWLGADGAMVTNAWVRDSVDWCYVGADGYCLTNAWKRDATGWCYLDSQGHVLKNNWVSYGGYWYWMDAQGYMVYNTSISYQNKTYYFNASGICINP